MTTIARVMPFFLMSEKLVVEDCLVVRYEHEMNQALMSSHRALDQR